MGSCLLYLTHGARWIMIAALAGTKTQIDLKNIYVRNVRIIGSTLRSRTPQVKAQILAQLVKEVFPKIETGEKGCLGSPERELSETMKEIEKKCRILPVQYARSVLSESMIFENGAADRVRPILFCVYLIQTQDRKILVDAGCETMPGFDMKDFIGPVKALNKLGVCPEEITDLFL